MSHAVKVLVISRNRESGRLYEFAVKEAGISLDSVGSLQDALLAATRNKYNGILVDLPTLIQAGAQEKESVYDLIRAYPVAKLRVIPSQNTLSLMCAGKCTASYATIEDFINGECLRFKARSFRSTTRKYINLPVLISPTAAFDAENTEKTFTVNISVGGFFVFSARRWNVGDKIWIRLADSVDKAPPIVGEVRWGIDWGQKSVIPGVGVRFKEISEEQVKEILIALT